MKKNHFGAAIIALFAILLSVFVFSCKGETNPVNVYYTITYESAHGTAPESKKVLSGTILAIQDLPTLTAAGYTFEGWYIGSSKITPELNYTVNSNIKLTAKWTEVSVTPPAPAPVYFTVTYVTERGQTPSSKSVLSGTALTAADLSDLTADGYAFEGWYIGSTKITAGYEVSGNITLTAKWRELPPAPVYYTITYVTERGQAPQSKSVLSGTALTDADLPNPTAQGYNFEGWAILGTKITAGYVVNDNITLTAAWTPVQTSESGFSLLVTTDTDITEDELNLALTAQKSGDSYILTATQGYDLYLWSVDGMYDDCGYDWDELGSSWQQLNEGNVPSVFVPNTLTFTEDNLPEDVAPDGTYVVYVQAFRKYIPEGYSSYKYKRVGLAFTVIKM